MDVLSCGQIGIPTFHRLCKIPDDMKSALCGICKQILVDPVSCIYCYKCYCKSCMKTWITEPSICLCGKIFKEDPAFPVSIYMILKEMVYILTHLQKI